MDFRRSAAGSTRKAVELPVKEGRSMAAIIESAVTNYLLSSMGQDSAKEFEERILRYIEMNKNGGNES